MFKTLLKTTMVASVVAGSLVATAAHSRIDQRVIEWPGIQQRPGIQPAVYVMSPREQVIALLREVIEAGWRTGFRSVVAYELGSMYTDNPAPASFRVRLRAGVQYRFAGRCDNDCFDLDLVLRNSNGRELIADRDFDATPAFTFRPRYTGEYMVQLELPDCRAQRCQVGAVVLARS
jgi:hypothetical protein